MRTPTPKKIGRDYTRAETTPTLITDTDAVLYADLAIRLLPLRAVVLRQKQQA